MKCIVKETMSRLAILLRWLAAVTTIATLHAQSITLKDKKGRSIEMLIDSATETEVAGRRKGDNKKVSIKNEMLDAESQKVVENWRKTTGRIPSQEFDSKLKYSDQQEYTVSFKMPAGNYNTNIDRNSITLTFDIVRADREPLSGKFYMSVYPTELSIKKWLDRELATINKDMKESLSRKTPSEREEIEPLLRPIAVCHGDFSGYQCGKSFSMTNGKYFINTYIDLQPQSEAGESPVTQDDLVKIIQTIKIKKGH